MCMRYYRNRSRILSCSKKSPLEISIKKMALVIKLFLKEKLSVKLSSEIMYERILSGNVKHYSRCVPTSANALDQPLMVARVRLSYNKVLYNKFSLFKKCHTYLSSLFLLHCPLYISYKFGSHFVPIQVLWPSRGIRVVRHSICLTPQPIRLTSI